MDIRRPLSLRALGLSQTGEIPVLGRPPSTDEPPGGGGPPPPVSGGPPPPVSDRPPPPAGAAPEKPVVARVSSVGRAQVVIQAPILRAPAIPRPFAPASAATTAEGKAAALKFLLDDLNNPEFATALMTDMETGVDVIYESNLPQVGKTKMLLTQAWILSHHFGRMLVIIVDNKNVDVIQLLGRKNQFNERLPPEAPPLNIAELSIGDDSAVVNGLVRRKVPTLLTIQFRRYERIFDLTLAAKEAGIPLTVLYDEADQSVGSVLEETGESKENIGRLLIERYPDTIFYYVTATPFAIENSPQRTQKRNVVIRIVPTNMYEHLGLYYRDFSSPCVHFHRTECLQDIKLVDAYSQEDFDKLREILREIIQSNQSGKLNQPEIALFNVSYGNEPKYSIMDMIEQSFPRQFLLVAYTGNGVEELSYLSVKDYKGREIEEKLTRRSFGTLHIGAYLQRKKDAGEKRPIMIFSTNLASRSQTFRSDDHRWILTRFFLVLAQYASMETTIQALRINGQYPRDAPDVTVYASAGTLDKIKLACENKERITRRLIEHQDADEPLRSALLQVPMLEGKLKTPLSRREIDDIKKCKTLEGIKCHGYGETEADALNRIADHQRVAGTDFPVLIVTKKYCEIPLSDVAHILRGRDIAIKLDKDIQRALRGYILDQCVRRGWALSTADIQLMYHETRARQLNQLLALRAENYNTEIIALDPEDRGYISVVIYQQITFPADHVLIWHLSGPHQRVCYYFNTEKAIPSQLPVIRKPPRAPTRMVEVDKAELWLSKLEAERGMQIVRGADIGSTHYRRIVHAHGYVRMDNDILVLVFLYTNFDGDPRLTRKEGMNLFSGKTFGQHYEEAMERLRIISEEGYEIFMVWESDFDQGDMGTIYRRQ